MEALVPLLAAVVAGLLAWIAAKRRNDASAAESIATAATTLVAPMQEQIAELRERIAVYENDNDRLRARVAALEEQIRSLGHTPVDHDRPRRNRH